MSFVGGNFSRPFSPLNLSKSSIVVHPRKVATPFVRSLCLTLSLLLTGNTFAIPRATAQTARDETGDYPHHAQMYGSSGGSEHASQDRGSGAPGASVTGDATNADQAEAVSIKQLQLPTGDLVYDSVTQKIYASVPSAVGAAGNSITPIDPMTATPGAPVFVGSEPGKLALSDDNRQLYVALDGAAAVRRFDMTSQTPGLQFSVGGDPTDGSFYVKDLAVMPGNSGVVAISRRELSSSPDFEGVAIYDNGVQRTKRTPGHTGSDFIEFSA